METTLNESRDIVNLRAVSGGSINHAFSFGYGARKLFIKINEKKSLPLMFEKEASGLRLLANASSLTVPHVVLHDHTEKEQFLVLEYMEKGISSEQYWEQLGTGLARLHKNSNAAFGLGYDNYVGSLVQPNKFHGAFSDFFVTMRLEPLLAKAIDCKYFDKSIRRKFEGLFRRLDEIIPADKPALLHGDLWSGNIMPVMNGAAVFDPAVYYGHREADLAMSLMFGGFHSLFYESYVAESPLEKGWENRVELFNIYPLLVHVHLFGGSYIEAVKAAISRF